MWISYRTDEDSHTALVNTDTGASISIDRRDTGRWAVVFQAPGGAQRILLRCDDQDEAETYLWALERLHDAFDCNAWDHDVMADVEEYRREREASR